MHAQKRTAVRDLENRKPREIESLRFGGIKLQLKVGV